MKKRIIEVFLFLNLCLAFVLTGISLMGGSGSIVSLLLLSLIISGVFSIYSIYTIYQGLVREGFGVLILSYVSFLYVAIYYFDEIGLDSFLFSSIFNIELYTILMWSPVVVIPVLILLTKAFSKK